jgi:hypothetical protein
MRNKKNQIFFNLPFSQKMKNKKGVNLLTENLVYILLVVVFVVIIFFAVVRVGEGAGVYEKIYAKQIAYTIDKSKSGMEFEIYLGKAHSIAEKNNFEGKIVRINNDENKVTVNLIKGEGYSYYYFSERDILWDIKDKRLILEIKKGESKNE